MTVVDRPGRRLFLRLVVLSLLVLSGTACVPRAQTDTSVPARFTFPPEWASHDAVWLGWSHDSAHHKLQVEIARALAPTVPVRILVTSDGAREQARAALAAAGVPSNRVDFFTHPVSNTWIRDAGPASLRRPQPGRGGLRVELVRVPGGDVAAVADTGADRQRPRR